MLLLLTSTFSPSFLTFPACSCSASTSAAVEAAEMAIATPETAARSHYCNHYKCGHDGYFPAGLAGK